MTLKAHVPKLCALFLWLLLTGNVSSITVDCSGHNFPAAPPEPKLSTQEVAKLRMTVREMFLHGYLSYMTAAYPLDELHPLACSGYDSWGHCSLTLIDSLDTLLVMGFEDEFVRVIGILLNTLDFNRDLNVSVFETNIRVLGGLLSAYLLSATKEPPILSELQLSRLLNLVCDLGKRLLPAFDTITGIPYGTVNLRHGVPPKETPVTCTAGAGTFALEFGILSLITGDFRFEAAARKAVRGLWEYRFVFMFKFFQHGQVVFEFTRKSY